MLWAGKMMVRNTGFEPVTSAMSRHCSTTELIAHLMPLKIKLDLFGRAQARLRARSRQVFFNTNAGLVSHRDILLGKELLGLMHGMFAKVKNTRCQNRICFAFFQDIHHVLKVTCPA